MTSVWRVILADLSHMFIPKGDLPNLAEFQILIRTHPN